MNYLDEHERWDAETYRRLRDADPLLQPGTPLGDLMRTSSMNRHAIEQTDTELRQAARLLVLDHSQAGQRSTWAEIDKLLDRRLTLTGRAATGGRS